MPSPTIVLVHGAFGDASSWRPVYDRLVGDGHTVLAPPNPLRGIPYDASFIASIIDQLEGPVVLVGHSYGGTLITHAGTDPRVAALVYIAALAPAADETSQSQIAKFPTTQVFGHIDAPAGRVWLKPSGLTHFAGDLPEAEQKLVYATQGAPVADLLTQKVDGTAWTSKPSWYILASKDQTVHPDLQHFVSKRMNATVTEVPSSHVPMLSKPDVVLDVIRKAANAVTAK